MHLSVFFRSYYVWLDRRAHELTLHLTADLLRAFIQQATLVLACDHEILRPGLLLALLGDPREDLLARLCNDERRAIVERQLGRLARASSVEVFRFEMTLVRDALSVAGLLAESWALFAEAVLLPEDLQHLERLVNGCHERCAAPSPDADGLRVDVLH